MKKLLAAIAFVLALSGCASVPMGDAGQDAALKTFKVAPDRAGIYIYRNESMGGAIRMDVTIDGVTLGQTAARTYLYTEVSPGFHTIVSKAENDDTIGVEVKPGTLTYVWQEVKMGALYARTKLHLVDEAQGRKGVQESKLAMSTSIGAAVPPTTSAPAGIGSGAAAATAGRSEDDISCGAHDGLRDPSGRSTDVPRQGSHLAGARRRDDPGAGADHVDPAHLQRRRADHLARRHADQGQRPYDHDLRNRAARAAARGQLERDVSGGKRP
jgi:hypothetical protein